MPKIPLGMRALSSNTARQFYRTRPRVKLVEVSPRDGLQNEKKVLSPSIRAQLIASLAQAGLNFIEAGSYVSPKVKQMSNTHDVLLDANVRALLKRGNADGGGNSVNLSVLIPNERGFNAFQETLTELKVKEVDTSNIEIAVFASATEAFSKANLNATRNEALDKLAKAAEAARKTQIRVRGYVSCVAKCPFEGIVEPREVEATAKALRDMGCYEISLGDTIGAGTPASMEDMLNAVVRSLPLEILAAHCHDTYQMALSNVVHLLRLGVRTVDSSIAGLGGCPFAPGASGNVATEDVVQALETSGYDTGLLDQFELGKEHHVALRNKLRELAGIGQWICSELEKESNSKAAKSLL